MAGVTDHLVGIDKIRRNIKMPIQSYLEKLGTYGIFSQKEYHAEAFSRNIGLLSSEEQEILAKSRIAIPGMGGVGGGHLITMVRTGIGKFNLADFDRYEPANINRQFGARVPDFDRPKLEVMKEQALSINPFLEINEFPGGINDENMDAFLDGVSLVIDALDFFAFDIRRQLFKRAREKGLHVITAGPLGFGSAMLVFAPDKGMAFDEYFNIVENMKPEDQYLAFALGLAPKALQFKYMDTSKVSFKAGKGPSLNIACQLCTGMAGTEAVRILLGKGGIKPVPYYFQFDPYLRKYCSKKLNMGNKHPWQRIKAKLVKIMLDRNARIEPEEPERPRITAEEGDQIRPDILDYIIRAGIQAPSGDNAQPWKFVRGDGEIVLYLNPEADRSFFNVNQAASHISCGAAIENMKLAAAKLGFRTEIQYGLSHADKIAVLKFSQDSGVKKDELADYIWKRNTNRKLFKQESVSSGLIKELNDSIKPIKDTEIHFITDCAKLEALAGLVARADRIRTERQDLHEHLVSMIRFSLDEAMEKRDGFYIKNLEAGADGELFLKITKSWGVMNAANKLGAGKVVANAAFKGFINSAGAGLVLAKGRSREDFLNGGRALERVWLSLTRAGYQFQPMTAITLFFLRLHQDGGKKFSKPHARMLDTLWIDYQKLFPVLKNSETGLIMLFRFGRGEIPRHGTLRFEKKSLIKKS